MVKTGHEALFPVPRHSFFYRYLPVIPKQQSSMPAARFAVCAKQGDLSLGPRKVESDIEVLP